MRATDDGTWFNYLTFVTGDAHQTDVAARTGIHQSTVSGWRTGRIPRPRPEHVVTVCRTYGASPIDGLVAAAYLTPEDVRMPSWTNPAAIPTHVLVSELARRNELGELANALPA